MNAIASSKIDDSPDRCGDREDLTRIDSSTTRDEEDNCHSNELGIQPINPAQRSGSFVAQDLDRVENRRYLTSNVSMKILGHSILVLLVDDDEFNRRVGSIMLEKMGHRVQIAADGPTALLQYGLDDFDLVLIDLQMPGMNGFETMKRIRELQARKNRRVPIVALTGQGSIADRQNALTSGMDEYLIKPLLEADLRSLVFDARSADRHAKVTRLNPWSLDPAFIQASYPMSDRALALVVTLFRESCDERLEQIHRAFDPINVEEITRNLHALKGSLAMFASSWTLDVVIDIEIQVKTGNFDRARRQMSTLEHAIDCLQSTLDQLIGH